MAGKRSMAITGTLLFIAISLALFELFSFIVVDKVLKTQAPTLILNEPARDATSQYASYLVTREQDLGWPSKAWMDKEKFDSSGSRFSPAYPKPGKACVSAYGDSFAFASQVENADAWTNALAKILRCRVANYGVPGYGTDQAYLRFLKNSSDEAKFSVLMIYPHNLMRNVNQYRRFLTGTGGVFSFKPRFIFDSNGELTPVALPRLSPGEFENLHREPAKYLSNEFFLPDTTWGPVTPGFPFSGNLIQLLGQQSFWQAVRSFVTGEPYWADFFDLDHSSDSAKITLEIVRKFIGNLNARGRRGLVVILSTPSSHQYFEKHGRWVEDSLTNSLVADGIDVIAFGAVVNERRNGKICALLTRPSGCAGHLNPEGNRFLAGLVAEAIAAK